MASPIQPEEHHISADQLLARAKDLIHQGNVRRLIVKNDPEAIVVQVVRSCWLRRRSAPRHRSTIRPRKAPIARVLSGTAK